MYEYVSRCGDEPNIHTNRNKKQRKKKCTKHGKKNLIQLKLLHANIPSVTSLRSLVRDRRRRRKQKNRLTKLNWEPNTHNQTAIHGINFSVWANRRRKNRFSTFNIEKCFNTHIHKHTQRNVYT